MLITAVDAHTGEPVVFDRHSGVELVDAVAASCASGFAYSIGDSRYIDGGYRYNAENADLAAGYARVLVLSPFGGRSRHPVEWGMHLATQLDELRAGGSRVETIFPDNDSERMFGDNVMDPSLRPPAARAGYNQGRAVAEQLADTVAVTALWCRVRSGVQPAGERRQVIERDWPDQWIGVAMHQLPAVAGPPEDEGDAQGHVLVGQAADLAVLALDRHQYDEVA